jgi:amino-acid racemase
VEALVKTIGLLGGMTWESTVVYYELINREIQRRLGGLHSARIVMRSFDFEDIAAFQRAGRWDEAGAFMAAAGKELVREGADFLALCCNTMHRVSPAIERETGVLLLHIADPLGQAILARGFSRVGLLGTRYTMQMPGIVIDRLKARHGVDVVVPEDDDADEIHRIIYRFQELEPGAARESARDSCRRAMAALLARGAQGIVLGCTELPLLVKPEDSTVPQFDTLTLHAAAIVRYALQ